MNSKYCDKCYVIVALYISKRKKLCFRCYKAEFPNFIPTDRTQEHHPWRKQILNPEKQKWPNTTVIMVGL